MTLAEMTTFVNLHNPLRSKIQITVSITKFHCGTSGTPASIANSSIIQEAYIHQNKFVTWTDITSINIYVTRTLFFLPEKTIRAMLLHELGHITPFTFLKRSKSLDRHIEHLADLYALVSNHNLIFYIVISRKHYEEDSLKEFDIRLKYMQNFQKNNLCKYLR